MTKKIIYVSPNTDKELHELETMKNKGTLYNYALKHDDDFSIYNDMDDFASAFNNGWISDEGFVFVVEK